MVQDRPDWPSGADEMSARLRDVDWVTTPLGPIGAWSERLKLIVEQVLACPLVSSLVCGPTRILIYNQAAARLYGDRHPAAFGRPLPESFQAGWATVAPFYERAFSGQTVQIAGQPLDTRGEGVASDVFDALLMPVREADGSVAYVHMTGLEVGDRLRTEAAMRDSEARHRLLVESGAQAVWETDAGGVVVADSPSWRAYTGQTVEEWLGYGWLNAIHPDDQAYAEQQWREAIAARRPVDAEFRLRAPHGGWRWTNVLAAPVLDDRGIIEKWTGLNIDNDVRRRVEAALRENEERFKLALEATDLAVYEWDLLSDRLTTNDRFRELVRIGADEAAVGAHIMEEVVHPDDRARIDPDLARAMNVASSGKFVFEHRLNRVGPLGVPWVLSHGQVYFSGPDIARRPTRVFGTLQDITSRKLAEITARESEERQAFLLKLSDRLRPLADPIAIQETACRLLAERLNVHRAYYVEIDEAANLARVGRDFVRGGAMSLAGEHQISDFAWSVNILRRGEPHIVADTATSELVPPTDLPALAALRITACAGVPLIKSDRLIGALCVTTSIPRDWTESETNDLREVGERIWAAVERTNAEAALRESEVRYRALFETMGQGYCLVEIVRDSAGDAIDLRYIELNPAWERLTGLRVAEAQGRTKIELLRAVDDVWLQTADRVVRTGQPMRLEHSVTAIGRTFEATYYPADGDRFSVTYDDITDKKRAETTLRESEERQAFLLKLSDTLRPLADPIEIVAQATRVLGEYMQADRTFIAMMEPDGVNLHVRDEYLRPGVSSVIGHHNFDQFGTFVSPRLVEGHVVAVEDVATLALTQTERAHYAAVGIAAYLLVPLVRDGRFAACFTCNHQTPRSWSDADKNIVRQTADRTWAALERARAEAALRESEERFRQFANASAAGLWVRDAKTLSMEFMSPAVAAIYGVEPGALLGDVTRWAAMIVPEDRDIALQHIEEACEGRSVTHEFRIQRPSDGAFRWVRNTDFPLSGNGHVQRIGGIAEDITEAKLAAQHSAVLLAELQHRVRNIMAVLRSITSRTAERAETVAEYETLMMGRLLAFARVQALLTRTADVSVGIAFIVRDEVSAQAQHEGQYRLEGPDVALSPKVAEILTLAIHELATNAAKYGALSVPDGTVAVRWSVSEKRAGHWLAFDWTETGAPARPDPGTPRRRGFGSELIEGRIPYELGGRGQVTIEPGGARCRLEFPLQDGASILETGAPERAAVFGGAIDMRGEPDLTGRRVLVVEDDYYLATDTARALRGAGAEVLGPCATEHAARVELDGQRPDAVVVDVNLGPGPSFKLAETLKDHGIPFVFTTGYDAEVIPAEFAGVERLQKPLHLRQIVSAVAKLTGSA